MPNAAVITTDRGIALASQYDYAFDLLQLRLLLSSYLLTLESAIAAALFVLGVIQF